MMSRGIKRATSLLTVVGALLVAARSGAVFPYPPPPTPCTSEKQPPACTDPADYARYLFLPTTEAPRVPRDFGADWKLTSAPSGRAEIDESPQELFGVTGASVDRAWQTTTGRPDVVIAVLDSGIRWAEPRPDLVNKFWLNRGELPVPEASTNTRDPYDRDGNGVFDLRDYLAGPGQSRDSRVRDDNGNGVIDPEDLIFLFSDGVDDDGNGFTDDISGWDFFEDDNDPLDEVRFGHGTGESQDSAAEADNDTPGVGTCPNCRLLEVRVGDSFVTNVNLFAQGVLFAVDSGARIVQEALGTLNQSAFGQQAVNYAFARGVLVVASAADEESYHNNFPASYDHTLEVNSVTRFADIGSTVQTPRSYLYVNGCTNFGGHIALAVPSSSCSSEATGRGAGMAALVVSAALDAVDRGTLTNYPLGSKGFAPFPLSADEVKQILTTTADDVNFDATPSLPRNYDTLIPAPGVQASHRFPSIAGWDQYFGYGRVNAEQAVRRVAAGRIPPEAWLESPAWFALLDPHQERLAMTGRVAAERASSFHYVVEAGPGVQPGESSFVRLFVSETRNAALEGRLASVTVASLLAVLPHGSEGPPLAADGSSDPERFALTLRVRVTDADGNMGEDRRTVFLHSDPDLLQGYPVRIGADGVSPPLTADLDGDGREELIFGTANGEVHARRLDGSELPGWPVFADPIEVHRSEAAFASGTVPIPRSAILGAVAAGDLDHRGSLDVVAADLAGKVYAWTAQGRLRPGFPVSTLPRYSHSRRSERLADPNSDLVPDRTHRHDRNNRLARGIAGGVTLGNLDASADGSLEILAGALDRHVYAWNRRGQPLPGWPVLLKDPAKVADVDPLTNEVTLTMDAGAEMGSKILSPPSMGDLDGDGLPEVLSSVNEEYRETPNAVFTNVLINLFIGAGVIKPGNTRVYAIHSDGTRHGGGPARGWNPAAFVDGWPVRTALLSLGILPFVGTGSDAPPVLVDLDGDGRTEVATASAFGPVYVFDGVGRSWLGEFDTGEALTLAAEPAGMASHVADMPAYAAFGGVTAAELDGPGTGYALFTPTAGVGRLLDANLPARQSPAENHLSAWHTDGSFLAAFPHRVNDLQFFTTPAVADIDGDGRAEVLAGSGGWDFHAVDAAGTEAPGWPKFTGGWMSASPAVGDLDGDGQLEVAALTREGNLFVWRSSGKACGLLPWRRFQHDEWGSGNAATDARPPGHAGDMSATVNGPESVAWQGRRIPGDDLYCGSAAHYEIRFASAPITDEIAFKNAGEVRTATAVSDGRGGVERIQASDPRMAGKSLYFAMIVRDAAGNRGPLEDLGRVTFPALPTATPTRTATPRPPTQTPITDSTKTSAGDSGGGCQITPTRPASPWSLLLPLFGVALLFRGQRNLFGRRKHLESVTILRQRR